MIVDTHAHVFARTLRSAADARYRPAYDANVEQYLALLDAHGVDAGVLVQPSFLASDNTYLLSALAQAPQRLRGVAVIDVSCTGEQLAQLHAAGVRGIRFNPYRRAALQLGSAAWRATLEQAAAFGWHVVVHEEGAALIDLLDQLRDYPGALVVDHLGRPQGDATADRAVETALLQRAARRYLDALGPQRLLWGSDWPWPNHEGRQDYAAMLAWLAATITEPAARAAIHAAAARLYGFAVG